MERRNSEEVVVPHVYKAKFPWTTTLLVIIYAVWCLLLLILTASGHFLNSQSLGCMNSEEDLVASRLKHEGNLVYLWSGINLLGCILVLLGLWRRKSFYIKALPGFICVLVLIMYLTFYYFTEKEAQEIKEFGRHHNTTTIFNNTLGHIQNQLTEPTCDVLSNVYHWQAEYKCCGLRGYQDWGSSVPDSCLCDGQDAGSGCVGVGNRSVYEKPCLPTVLSLVETRSSTFWAVMIAWIVIAAAPIVLGSLCVVIGIFVISFYMLEWLFQVLHGCLYKACGGEEMVPVVFVRKNTKNQEEENGNDEEEVVVVKEVVEANGGKSAESDEGEGAEEDEDIPVTFIPLSELTRLQEELDPSPVQHEARCMCLFSCKARSLYTVLLDEGSPLLPGGAIMVGANKTTGICVWGEGHHVFVIENLVLPRERDQDDLV